MCHETSGKQSISLLPLAGTNPQMPLLRTERLWGMLDLGCLLSLKSKGWNVAVTLYRVLETDMSSQQREASFFLAYE